MLSHLHSSFYEYLFPYDMGSRRMSSWIQTMWSYRLDFCKCNCLCFWISRGKEVWRFRILGEMNKRERNSPEESGKNPDALLNIYIVFTIFTSALSLWLPDILMVIFGMNPQVVTYSHKWDCWWWEMSRRWDRSYTRCVIPPNLTHHPFTYVSQWQLLHRTWNSQNRHL
jgi:hypothetical protein